MSDEGIQVLSETLLTFKAMLEDFEVTDVKAARLRLFDKPLIETKL